MDIRQTVLDLYNEEHVKNRLSYKQIQHKYGIPRGTWNYHAKKLCLTYDGRTNRCNDDHFDILTPNACYILWFLYADGCLSRDGRISVCIHHKDREVVDFIKEEIEIENKIYLKDYDPKARAAQTSLRFTSKKIMNRLTFSTIFQKS